MDKVKVIMIGLGSRGSSMLFHVARMDNYDVIAVCDTYEDRAREQAGYVRDHYHYPIKALTDWREALELKPDAVLITTGWEGHFEIAFEAMKRGIAVGCEVGGAYSIDECFELVEMQHKTRTPYMLLENCCYGEYEMLVMNMVKLGLFGDIVACEGGYHHDIRTEILFGNKNRHYRLHNYLTRNCENYPTHELGPIAQVLDINRSNYFTKLTSFTSGSLGLNDYARLHDDVDPEFRDAKFVQGDIIKTVIECSGGQLITLTLDTCLPRPYSRGFTVRGTRGMYSENENYIFLDTDHTEHDAMHWNEHWNNAEKYLEKYEHPLWKAYKNDGVRGGHGGMDYLVYHDFAQCLIDGRPMPISVEDAAAWMAVTPLSEQSLKTGSTVEFPNFCRQAAGAELRP